MRQTVRRVAFVVMNQTFSTQVMLLLELLIVLPFTVNAVATPPPPQNLFAQIDKDGDGELTMKEVSTFFEQSGQQGVPNGLWQDNDLNQDGLISWAEFVSSAWNQ